MQHNRGNKILLKIHIRQGILKSLYIHQHLPLSAIWFAKEVLPKFNTQTFFQN